MPDEIPQQVLFQKNYDKECQHEIETGIAALLKTMTGYCIDTGATVITDAEVVAHITGNIEEILQKCKQLYLKYKEPLEKIERVETEISGLFRINCGKDDPTNGPDMRDRLKKLQIMEIQDIALKHKLMDKTMEREPWEKGVKKKFFLNEIPEEEWAPHELYLQGIRRGWKKLVFLETAYMVMKNGDIVKLISGINNSGKTWTSLPQARMANWYLRNYWAPQKPSKNLAQETLDDLKKVKPFSMKRDVSYYPDPDSIRAKIAEGTRFNTTPITEGMKAAINIRSWDPKVIDMILEIFTERASNNYMSFEYQLTRRPPKMLLARFNVWEHKPSQKWMVVSMPSSVYRTEDPLLTKEIEKLKGDRQVSHWLTHKKGNSNFVAKLKAPTLSPKYDALFKINRKEAKEEYEKGRKVKMSIGNEWYNKIAEYHKLVETGQMAYIKIPDLLKARKFNDAQVAQFLRDFNKWDRVMKLNAPEPKLEEVEAE